MTEHALDDSAATLAPPRPRPRGLAVALLARWPTWLALVLAAAILSGLSPSSDILIPAAFIYLGTAVIRRPRAAWLVLIATLPLALVLQAFGIDQMTAVLVLSAGFAAVGLVSGTLRQPGPPRLQAPAMVVFAAVALLAATVPPVGAAALVGLGLLGHAAWDLYHWRVDRIVSRSYSEWCGVLDAVVGIGVLVMAALQA